MDQTADAIFVEAMKLSPPDRQDLAVLLMGSVEKEFVDSPLDAEWDAEIERRVEEIRSGAVECIPAEEVHRRMRERLGE